MKKLTDMWKDLLSNSQQASEIDDQSQRRMDRVE